MDEQLTQDLQDEFDISFEQAIEEYLDELWRAQEEREMTRPEMQIEYLF